MGVVEERLGEAKIAIFFPRGIFLYWSSFLYIIFCKTLFILKMETLRVFEALKGKTVVSDGEVTLSLSIAAGQEMSGRDRKARDGYLQHFLGLYSLCLTTIS